MKKKSIYGKITYEKEHFDTQSNILYSKKCFTFFKDEKIYPFWPHPAIPSVPGSVGGIIA